MNEKGFTFVETLLVLAVLTILTIIASQIVVKVNEKRTIDYFFNQLQLDIETVQSYSIEKNSRAYLKFLSPNKYRATHHLGTILFERELPKNVRFEMNSNLKTLEFVNGKVQKFGTLVFYIDDEYVIFTVYIERGRTRIVEQ